MNKIVRKITTGNITLILLLAMSAHGSFRLFAQEKGLYLYRKNDSAVISVDRDGLKVSYRYEFNNRDNSEIRQILPTPGGASVYAVFPRHLEVFNAENGSYEKSFSLDWSSIASISFSPKGERLFVIDRGKLLIYRHQRLELSLQNEISLDDYASHENSPSIVFNKRGSKFYIASGTNLLSGDGYSGRINESIELPIDAIHAEISGNDRFLWISGTRSGGQAQSIIVDTRRFRIQKEIANPELGTAFTLDQEGRGIYVLSPTGQSLTVLDNQSGRLIESHTIPQSTSIFIGEGRDLWLAGGGAVHRLPLDNSGIKKPEHASLSTISADTSSLPFDLGAIGSIKQGGGFACF